jgi:transposase
MAVRGLGCPVRFTLTAGQRGDCPQAYGLIDGLPAEVVIADAYLSGDDRLAMIGRSVARVRP